MCASVAAVLKCMLRLSKRAKSHMKWKNTSRKKVPQTLTLNPCSSTSQNPQPPPSPFKTLLALTLTKRCYFPKACSVQSTVPNNTQIRIASTKIIDKMTPNINKKSKI